MMRDEPFLAFESAEDACLLAQAIVDTVREPLLVLDRDLRIIAASRSFYLDLRDDAPGHARAQNL